MDGVEQRVDVLHPDAPGDALVVRHSPGRCIVQLGHVALTLTWLRSTLGHVSEGTLLIVVWRGAVAPTRRHQPERPSGAPATWATSVWEDSFTVEAEDEKSWRWRGTTADCGAYTSDALADRCVEQLQLAHAVAA